MKPVIYIHIGPHKTGTTSIQHSLFENEDLLRNKGVLCPKTGRPWHNSAATHNLAWQLRNPYGVRFKSNDGTWEDLFVEIGKFNDIEKVILSSEDFCLLRLEQFQQLGELTKDFPTKIILYLRRQDQALQSLWAEFMRNSNTPNEIEHFFDWLEKYNYSYASFEYLKIVNKLEKVFSRENIILRIFDPSDFKENLFYDFLNLCGVDPTGCKLAHDANVSSGAKTIEAVRFIKRSINFNEIDNENWTYIVNSIDKFGNKQGWNNEKMNFLDERLSEIIMQHHDAENNIIAKQYFERDELFTKIIGPKKNASSFSLDDFSMNEVIGLFSYIIENMVDYKK